MAWDDISEEIEELFGSLDTYVAPSEIHGGEWDGRDSPRRINAHYDGRPERPTVQHGTRTRYVYHRCRCAECRAAHAKGTKTDRADRRKRIPADKHGKPGTYENWGCRCKRCLNAMLLAKARRLSARIEAGELTSFE